MHSVAHARSLCLVLGGVVCLLLCSLSQGTIQAFVSSAPTSVQHQTSYHRVSLSTVHLLFVSSLQMPVQLLLWAKYHIVCTLCVLLRQLICTSCLLHCVLYSHMVHAPVVLLVWFGVVSAAAPALQAQVKTGQGSHSRIVKQYKGIMWSQLN